MGWLALAFALLLGCVCMPAAALLLPADHPLALSAYGLTLMGKIFCYALAALGLGLAWGYCGILSLGHGLFFALGAYAFGMHLMRTAGADSAQTSALPDFMLSLGWKELPWFWRGSEHFGWAVLLVLVAPALVALVFGFFAFRSRIKGVYLSIVTQALSFAAMQLFLRNETGFGGSNGFTDFRRILGFEISALPTRAALFALSLLALAAAYLLCRHVVTSKLGRVARAVRDAETRVMFCGYDPLPFKLFIWVLSALLCAVAGALYVPQAGIINPNEMAPLKSIEMAVWVTVGGRGSLAGPILGAFAVNGASTVFTSHLPDFWPFFLGALFVGVTLWLPQGLMGLLRRWPRSPKPDPSAKKANLLREPIRTTMPSVTEGASA
nr:urea ABC transporter permease subunit UrtC [Comamonas composti]